MQDCGDQEEVTMIEVRETVMMLAEGEEVEAERGEIGATAETGIESMKDKGVEVERDIGIEEMTVEKETIIDKDIGVVVVVEKDTGNVAGVEKEVDVIEMVIDRLV